MLIFLYEVTFTFCMMCITLENVRRHFSLAGENVVEVIFSKVSLFSLAFIPFLALVPFGVKCNLSGIRGTSKLFCQ